ncbi:MAG: hypothetical protein BGO78_11515 [Chloroflexi bacterium 44-23]|nr:MAG: hypothetical protein BGO78_11515 [Chloroflexi bacterium 44-23]
MGAFLDKEKFHQEQFLRQSGYFIETHPLNEIRPTRLPQALASQNLNPAIRADALDTFERDHIQWPRGSQALPSPDLCDISVNCVNFLYPFSTRPDALADLMGMIFPTLQTILPFENGAFINFFWPHDPQKSNADAAFIFQRHDSKRQMVLLHWNYCETYSPAVLNEGQNYAHLSAADLPLKNDQLEDINQLFYQPFLRLLELQLLAQQLEKERCQNVDLVSVLQIMPVNNLDLLEVVSPGLRKFGISPTQIWQNLVQPYDRFTSTFTENLFGHFDISSYPEMLDWWLYITRRYPWVVKK